MRNGDVRPRAWHVTDSGKNDYRKDENGEETKVKCGQVNLVKVGFRLLRIIMVFDGLI